MIKEHCFGKDWFLAMSKKYKYNDLGIIEKVIRAYALLDLLARSGCPYICDYALLQDGVKRLGSFIYENKYFIEDAIVDSAKAAYAATCIENKVVDIHKYSPSELSMDMTIRKNLPGKLNRLKKSNAEAFYYWFLIDNML